MADIPTTTVPFDTLTQMTSDGLDIKHGFPLTDPNANTDYFITLANILNSPKNYWFAQCNTDASIQVKDATLTGFLFNIGVPINILFCNGNSFGLPGSGSNVIADGSGALLRINNGVKSMSYDIISGASEAVGESFVQKGGVHEFIITQAATDSVHGKIYDKSATVLYSHSDANSSYTKYTDGHIEYYNTPEIISKTIENGQSYSTPDLSSWSAGILVIGGGNGYYSVYEYHKLNIAFMNKISGNYNFSVSISNGIITIINSTGDALVVKMFYYSGY